MSYRYVVEIEGGWQGIEFKEIVLARVYQKDKGWPTRRQRPLILLTGDEATAEGAAEALRLWLKDGARTPDELKAVAR
jgi:ribosome-interacting GTPase 1